MILSRYTLKNIHVDSVSVPDESLFELPEKVLQFGTGILLRGLPDYFIDKANEKGLFNGRIVAVKTTPGDTTAFNRQDGLFTHSIRENGIETNRINSSISRVLSAKQHWNEILDCAHSRDMQIIISNTTETGIQLLPEDIRQHPPKSYPGKLLSFLYERFKAFGGSAHSGMVIIPTELIPDNGKKLESIVLELAHLNGLEDEFIEWIEKQNSFCNSIVDRMVSMPDEAELSSLKSDLGYEDHLLVLSEDYCRWEIEGNEKLKEILSFANADDRVGISSNIDTYGELVLSVLNSTITLTSGLAFLSGCQTVKDAMNDKTVSSFLTNLLQNEIIHSLPGEVELTSAQKFASELLVRFDNPCLNFLWSKITSDYSARMKAHCVPVLMQHYTKSDAVPEAMALGFAAYIYFMKAVKKDDQYFGEFNGKRYLIQDEQAGLFYKYWLGWSSASMVHVVLSDASWGADLLSLPGFKQSVIDRLNLMVHNGMKDAVESTPLTKIKVA